LHIVMDVIQAFRIQIPHCTLSCLLFSFLLIQSHSLTLCLVLFSFSPIFTHSPSSFLCNYKTHFQFFLCCYKEKQIANNVIHVTSWLWRLKVPMNPSMKPWHSFQLRRQVIMVVDSNLELSEGGVRLDLDRG
jgi:hypothetical protein